jgi:hypothetical protein
MNWSRDFCCGCGEMILCTLAHIKKGVPDPCSDFDETKQTFELFSIPNPAYYSKVESPWKDLSNAVIFVRIRGKWMKFHAAN